MYVQNPAIQRSTFGCLAPCDRPSEEEEEEEEMWPGNFAHLSVDMRGTRSSVIAQLPRMLCQGMQMHESTRKWLPMKNTCKKTWGPQTHAQTHSLHKSTRKNIVSQTNKKYCSKELTLKFGWVWFLFFYFSTFVIVNISICKKKKKQKKSTQNMLF